MASHRRFEALRRLLLLPCLVLPFLTACEGENNGNDGDPPAELTTPPAAVDDEVDGINDDDEPDDEPNPPAPPPPPDDQGNGPDDEVPVEPPASLSAMIPPAGGVITYPGIGTITFPPNTFLSDHEVIARLTDDPSSDEPFDLATVLFGLGTRASHELRITTGGIKPSQPVRVALSVPDELLTEYPEFRPVLLAQIMSIDDTESFDYFEGVISTLSEADTSLTATIPTDFFWPDRVTGETFEAVLLLAALRSDGAIEPPPPAAIANAFEPPAPACGISLRSPLDQFHVTSDWGPRDCEGCTPFHRGIDLRALTPLPVYAVADAIVLEVRTYNGYGKVVVLGHEGELKRTLYAHLSDQHVTQGQRVVAGQRIGTTGNSGTKHPHLHFELIDPTGIIANGDPMSATRHNPEGCFSTNYLTVVGGTGTGNYTTGILAEISARPVFPNAFDQWSGDGIEDIDQSETAVRVDANKTVTAVFECDPNMPDYATGFWVQRGYPENSFTMSQGRIISGDGLDDYVYAYPDYPTWSVGFSQDCNYFVETFFRDYSILCPPDDPECPYSNGATIRLWVHLSLLSDGRFAANAGVIECAHFPPYSCGYLGGSGIPYIRVDGD